MGLKMKNFSQALITTLTDRNAVAPSADLVTSINNAKSHARALDALFGSVAFNPVAKKLLASLTITDAKQNREDFVAVKVAVKIINTANGLAKGEKSLLDPYSRTIIENLIRLQSVTNKSALVSLSNAIVFTDDDQKQKLTNKYNCSAGTAGTQASSTRMMLRSLDICEVLKSKRGDTLTLKDNARAQLLVELFNGKAKALPLEPVKAEKAPTTAAKAKAPTTAAKVAPVAKAPTTGKAAAKVAPIKEAPKAAVKEPAKVAAKAPVKAAVKPAAAKKVEAAKPVAAKPAKPAKETVKPAAKKPAKK
jgi:hypothetical protein